MSSVKGIRSRCANPFHKEIHLVKSEKSVPLVEKTLRNLIYSNP